MAKPRKPIPKSQLTLSTGKQTAFRGIEDRGEAGNPNSSISPPNPNYTETGIDFNRSNQMSFRDDNTKQYSIGIKDIDEAVFFYFQNVIRPFVYQNGERREVPVIYGAPERWKSFQRDGYYRDKSGAIMLPILVIKRDTISKDRTVANKLDANMPNLYGQWSKEFSSTATELTQGKDRLVTGTFNIRLRGYILPDTIQKELNATKVYNSKAKVTITTETTNNIEDIDF